MKEEWRDIPGFEGLYQASTLGRIRSLNRSVWSPSNGSYSKIGGRVLKPDTIGKLYAQVHICRNGKSKNFLVHRLVAMTFIPNPLNKATVNHKDLNKLNNRVDNLEWATQKENYGHALKNINFNYVRGEKQPTSKITDKIVKEIRTNSLSLSECGRKYGISIGTVSMVRNRKTWRHVN